jgi:hypothetical protein
MSKIKLFSKVVPFVLIVSIVFTACDVPDISEFTTNSAEMTRGIRKGIKDTGETLETASKKTDLFLPKTIEDFGELSKKYSKIMEPTVETLNALDEYLDMLNALAQANRKSEENAKAAVGAVSSLITTASKLFIFAPSAAGDAFAVPDKIVQISTGLLSIGEQFRTAKSFKDRVTLSARIVEGAYKDEVKVVEVDGVRKEVTESKKVCTQEAKQQIKIASNDLDAAINKINTNPRYSPARTAELIKSEEQSSSIRVSRFGCGIIDLLKFTVQDLKLINTKILSLTEANLTGRHKVVLELKGNFDRNNARVRKGVNQTLTYTESIETIRNLEIEYAAKRNITEQEKKDLLDFKIGVLDILRELFILDPGFKRAVTAEIKKCEMTMTCSGMGEFINFPPRKDDTEAADLAYDKQLGSLLDRRIGAQRFEIGNQAIEAMIEKRARAVADRNEIYRIEEERLKPDYAAAASELNEIKARQTRLNKAFNESVEALDLWTLTHAKLRVTLTTKKPFSVARFVSKVKTLMALFEPKAS